MGTQKGKGTTWLGNELVRVYTSVYTCMYACGFNEDREDEAGMGGSMSDSARELKPRN